MKKQNISFAIIIGICAVVSFSSCTKNLNEYNPSGGTADIVWSTPQGFLTAVNGAYSYVPYLYGSDENELFLSEGGTDLWYNYNKATYDVEITQYKNFTSASNPVKGVWTTLYKAINLCNAGIGRIGNAGFTTVAERNKREAELRFLRAFYYWHVVETWGGVVLDTTESQGVNLTAKRSSVDDYYKLIISDLQFAVANLPTTYGGGYEYGRATQGAALGFLARAYLSRAYYSSGAEAADYFQKAKDIATQVINRKGEFNVSLYPNYSDLWNPANRNPDNGTKNKEALFVATFSTNTALNINGNADRTHMWFLTNYSGYSGSSIPGLTLSLQYGNDQKNRRFMPTLGLLDLYDDQKDSRYDGSFQEVWLCNKAYTWTASDVATFKKDPSIIGKKMNIGDTAMWITKQSVPDKAMRPYAVFDRDTTYNTSTNKTIKYGDRYVVLKKYLDPITRTGTTTYPGYLDVIIMRLAEMYLIAAEADFQLGNNAEAADFINVLRTRAAKKTPVDYTAAMQVSASDITLDFIMDERARELCGEYQRWFDLKRTHTLESRIQRLNPDITSFNQAYYLRPVPLVELQALTNAAEFGQNPGY